MGGKGCEMRGAGRLHRLAWLPEWSTGVVRQSGPPGWPAGVASRSCPPEWPAGVVRQSGQPEWNARVVRRRGQPEWSTGVASRSGRPEWPAGVVRQSGQPEWQAGVASRSGRPEWPAGVASRSGPRCRLARPWLPPEGRGGGRCDELTGLGREARRGHGRCPRLRIRPMVEAMIAQGLPTEGPVRAICLRGQRPGGGVGPQAQGWLFVLLRASGGLSG